MPNLIQHPEHLTPAWLTQLWYEQARLTQGQAERVTITASARSNPSTVYHLQVTYTPNTDLSRVPQTLFLKISNADFPYLDDNEVVFYQAILPEMRSVFTAGAWPFLYCYHANYDPASRSSIETPIRATFCIRVNQQVGQ